MRFAWGWGSVLLLLCASAFVWRTADLGRPAPTPGEPAGGNGRIVFDPPAVDLGSVPAGGEKKGSLTLRNDGVGPLQIHSVSSQCRCTLVRSESFRLGPGESRVLEFALRPTAANGHERSMIFIDSDDQRLPRASVPIFARVESTTRPPRLRLSPTSLEIARNDLGRPVLVRLDNAHGLAVDAVVRASGAELARVRVPAAASVVVPLDLSALGACSEADRDEEVQLLVGGEVCASLALRLFESSATEREEAEQRQAVPLSRHGLMAVGAQSVGAMLKLDFGASPLERSVRLRLEEKDGRARRLVAARCKTSSRAFSFLAASRLLPAHGAVELEWSFHPGLKRGRQQALWQLEFDQGLPLRVLVEGYSPGEARHEGASLRLLASGNQRGALDPCECGGRDSGGIARLVSKARDSDDAVKVHVGGLIDPASKAASPLLREGMHALVRAGFHAMVPAAGELAVGHQTLLEAGEATGLAWIGANVVDLDDRLPLLPAYRLVTVGEEQIAVIGVVGLQELADARVTRAGFDLLTEEQGLRRALDLLPDSVAMIVVAGSLDRSIARHLVDRFTEIDVVLMGAELRPEAEARAAAQLLTVPSSGHGLVLADGRIQGRGFRLEATQHVALETEVEEDPATLEQWRALQEALADLPLSPLQPNPRFVGSAACRSCHPQEWEAHGSSAHAHAFDTLVRARRPHDPDCLRCHTVGFDEGNGYRRLSQSLHLAEVGCESCHGPGGDHVERSLPLGVARACVDCHTPHESPHFERESYWSRIGHGASFERRRTSE